MIKQVFVSLEIGENDIKMLVAEYFNARFNVLKVEKKSTLGLNDYKVIDEQQFISDLIDLKDTVSKKIGATIEKVILVLPDINFKRYPINININSNDQLITKKDIYNTIKKSLSYKVDNDVVAVDTNVIKYIINGFSSRKIPEKEVNKNAFMDVDLLCLDKQMTYTFVTLVEKAGLGIVDITTNAYAVCKEANLLDKSLKENIIYLNINKSCTFLNLISKGKLLSSAILNEGLDSLINKIRVKYEISDDDILKLLKFNVNLDSKYKEEVVFAYSENGLTKSITVSDLNEIIAEPLSNYLDKIITICEPILKEESSFFITGEGQQVACIINELKNKSNIPVNAYFPETIGLRDSLLTALYGALYAYRDKVILSDEKVDCIDLLQLNALIDERNLDTEGETITTKIKNFFKQYIER